MTDIHFFKQKKSMGAQLSMVTCYGSWSARILNRTDLEFILVEDSVAFVMHGFDSSVHATFDMMELHTSAVARGAPGKFIVADMPFMSCSKGIETALEIAARVGDDKTPVRLINNVKLGG